MDSKTTKPPATGKSIGSPRKQKPLIDPADPLRGLKLVLDQLVVECNSVPPEIRQQLDTARRTAWQLFVKQEEEALNAKTS